MMTHPLYKWLEANKITQTDFAKSIGISRMHIWRVLNGDNSLSVATMQKISAATGGKISLTDLLPKESAA